MPYLTPDTAPGNNRCRVLSIPDDKIWLALVRGALTELCKEYNYEQFGTATIEETVQRFQQMMVEFEDCGPNLTDIIVCADHKTSGTGGGTFVAGAWRTRDLNTKLIDTASIATLSANQITVPAGTYRVLASAPARRVDEHQIRLYNVTGNVELLRGSNAYSAKEGAYATTHSFIDGRFTIAVQSTIEVQHICNATNSFGNNVNQSPEVYTVIRLERE